MLSVSCEFVRDSEHDDASLRLSLTQPNLACVEGVRGTVNIGMRLICESLQSQEAESVSTIVPFANRRNRITDHVGNA